MFHATEIPTESAGRDTSQRLYRVGTLTYTKAGLLVVGAWLLWGDFCLTLMEAVVPSIIPIKLKSLGASDWVIGLIVSTLPSMMGMAMGPYISFKSDRYRGRWGRRIPFIVWTMPFLCASIFLLGMSQDISAYLHARVAMFAQFAPATFTIALIGVFMAVFQFFNMFVYCVFWYLFNDVFPAEFLGRLIGALRVVGAVATALYNYFIFQYAESHAREIFIAASALYLVGFGLMCLKVREGRYPPVEVESSRGLAGFKTFFRESYSDRFYWLLYLGTTFQGILWVIAIFQVFFYTNMGLSLDQIGKYNALTGLATFCALYFSAIYIDRWHPLRVTVYVSVFSIVTMSMNWVWIFADFPAGVFYWLFLGSGLAATFQVVLYGAANQPRDMRLFPRTRYGQFSSAQALLRGAGAVAAGILAGVFIDAIKQFYPAMPDRAYRYIFIWQTIFAAVMAWVSILAYRKWYELGGDAAYRSPARWACEGFEEMPTVPAVGPQSRWLGVTFALFNATMAAAVLGVVLLMFWMRRTGATIAFNWFAYALLPLSIGGWIYWRFVEHRIRQDMRRALAGQPLHNGIPHHGVLIVTAIQALLSIALWVVQVVLSIRYEQQRAAIAFGASSLIANVMLAAGVQLMARVERGRLVTLDCNINDAN